MAISSKPWGPYYGTVTNIHDGDTVTLAVWMDSDLGFDIKVRATLTMPCRLYGINAPELSTQAGKDALAFLQTRLHLGDQVTVLSYGWDKYARFDGVITLPDGTNLNQLMVETGHAVPYSA